MGGSEEAWESGGKRGKKVRGGEAFLGVEDEAEARFSDGEWREREKNSFESSAGTPRGGGGWWGATGRAEGGRAGRGAQGGFRAGAGAPEEGGPLGAPLRRGEKEAGELGEGEERLEEMGRPRKGKGGKKKIKKKKDFPGV